MAGQVTQEEKELVCGCVSGDRKSQEALYRRFSGKMYSVCLGYAGSREDAMDILQEGFLKVFRSIGKFKSDGSLEGWIRRIIVNTAIDHYRQKAKMGDMVKIEQAKKLEVPAEVMEKINSAELLDLVHRLPDGARLIFNLFAIEGYSHEEIAGKLGITEGTSKSQVSRARALLQEMMIKLNKPGVMPG